MHAKTQPLIVNTVFVPHTHIYRNRESFKIMVLIIHCKYE